MAKKNRNWIFTLLLTFGIILSLVMLITQSNVIYKNSDFKSSVYFEGEEGDSGYLVLERNYKTPSVVDWVTFVENNKTAIFFSDSIIKEKISVDLPSPIESGLYYFNVKAVFISGKEEIKEIKFRVI